jgi:hypothetical protein
VHSPRIPLGSRRRISRQAAGLEKIQIFVSSLISALLSKLSFSPRLTALLRHNHKLQVRPPRHSSPLHGPTNNNNISIVLRSSSSNLPQVPRSSAIREPPHSRLVDLPHLSNHYWSLKRQKLSSISSIFGIQALDHAPHGCCLISTLHSRYPCYSSRAVLRKHSRRTTRSSSHFCLIHGLSLLSSALSRHLVIIAIAIRLVQPSIYLWSSSCCPTDHVTLSLSLYSPIVAAAVISVFQVTLSLSSCRCYAHLCCRPLHPRHKSQHPSLAGARPLERAYCHESCYVSYGLNL